MTTNRPSCPLCGNNTKKNGTTSKSTTRWRCTHCGHSFTRNTQTHNKNTATMALFIQWATGTQSLTTFAAHHGVTRQTMHHRFRWCWWIIPTPTIDSFRIHDQIFLDATYLKSGCLLIAASKTHVGPDPRKVDTSGVSYAAWVSVADVSASKSLGARRLHQECRLRVL
ncbi:transposase IS3503f [Corynebacterium jeikeium]|nr:hypothetical protein CJEIK_09760 [Corynebacterium jeikeium]SUY80249.1 transposase IS3503f [Corynebacterium jeikeium]